MEFLVRLGEAFARLVEPLHVGKGRLRLSKGRLRLSEPLIVRGLCLWLVLGRSHGPIYDCLWLASGPLYDLFKSVIA